MGRTRDTTTTFGSERVWCRLLGQKEFGKKPRSVTRGIEHVGKGLKAISTKYLTADRTGARGRKKYSKSGVLNALLRTFVGIECRQTQAPEATRLGRSNRVAIDARDEGVDPGDA